MYITYYTYTYTIFINNLFVFDAFNFIFTLRKKVVNMTKYV